MVQKGKRWLKERSADFAAVKYYGVDRSRQRRAEGAAFADAGRAEDEQYVQVLLGKGGSLDAMKLSVKRQEREGSLV